MLKREIKYEDFNGNKTSDIFYFNLSEHELVDLEVAQKQGLQAMLQEIIDTKDHKGLIELFKKIIMLSYGEKSSDGKRFIKSEQSRLEFSQSAAYNTLFMELATDDGAAATFLIGTLPSSMTGEIKKAMITGPTPVPNT